MDSASDISVFYEQLFRMSICDISCDNVLRNSYPFPFSVATVSACAAKSQVAAHKRIHMSKQEECPVCQKKFTDKHKLRRHMLVHTGAKDFSCPFCDYKCNIEANLRKHCKNVHKEIYPPRKTCRVNERLQHKADGEQTIEVLLEAPPDAMEEVDNATNDRALRLYELMKVTTVSQQPMENSGEEQISLTPLKVASPLLSSQDNVLQYVELSSEGHTTVKDSSPTMDGHVMQSGVTSQALDLVYSAHDGITALVPTNIPVPIQFANVNLSSILIVPQDGSGGEVQEDDHVIAVAGDEVVIMAMDEEVEGDS